MSHLSLPDSPREIEAQTDDTDSPCPSVSEIEQLLRTGRVSCSRVDEVWPNLFIGDADLGERQEMELERAMSLRLLEPPTGPSRLISAHSLPSLANNRFELWKLGITHVLNAAHGGLCCQGGPDFYGSCVSYLGVPAHDLPDFNISAYFSSAADFIHNALLTPGAKVLVHCVVGISRSATLVLAYLMLRQGLTLRQAVNSVKQRRWIFPNSGFLKQLCQLDRQLQGAGGAPRD
uniref:Dual specificity phosphatase 13A n=1 Tax=Vombatus ursinus TaxID=29139 RepID=A0A4X2L2H7_VOMUR